MAVWLTYNGKGLTYGTCALGVSGQDPYNPLNLPPYTARIECEAGWTPTFNNTSKTQVSVSPNVWDITYENTNWNMLFSGWLDLNKRKIIRVLGANTENVIRMDRLFDNQPNLVEVKLFDTSNCWTVEYAFANCSSLTSIPDFNYSSVIAIDYMLSHTALTSFNGANFPECTQATGVFSGSTALASVGPLVLPKAKYISSMFGGCTALVVAPSITFGEVGINASGLFNGCTALRQVPLYDTSGMSQVDYMFDGCTSVESGALALYQQMSTQATVPYPHQYCFRNCGSGNTAGSAELAQIPSDWK